VKKCFYCRRPLAIHEETRDHFIARSKGGKGPGNRVPACKRCNQAKADRGPTMQEIERFHREGFAIK